MTHSLHRSSKLYLSIVFLFLFVTLHSKAQSVKRQSIASSGSSGTINGISIHQTVGQPYFTSGYYDKETGFRPGFQQNLNLSLEFINSTFNLRLNVFPNPATNSVTIESSDIIKNALIQIRDINGKLVLEEKIAELKTYSLNCETWANGSYFIALYDEQNNNYSSKLIITK